MISRTLALNFLSSLSAASRFAAAFSRSCSQQRSTVQRSSVHRPPISGQSKLRGLPLCMNYPRPRGFFFFGLFEEIALIFVTKESSLSSAPDARANSTNLSCCDFLRLPPVGRSFGIEPSLIRD